MAILDLQLRHRRRGEIRIGKKGDKGQPVKLDTFRLTSSDYEAIRDAAELYGGTPERWGDKWEVVTTVSVLPVRVPVQDPENLTWYEHWTAGGLQRRCDGETIQSDATKPSCQCDPAKRECVMTTRINFVLPELKGISPWKFESHGYNAAVELGAAVNLIYQAMARTGMIPEATLEIEERVTKRPGEPTRRYIVPVLNVNVSFNELVPPALASPGTDPVTPRYLPSAGSVPEPLLHDSEIKEVALREVSAAEPDSEPGSNAGEVVASLVTGVDGSAAGNPSDPLPHELLDEEPDAGTIPDIESRVRALYAAMSRVGVWEQDAFRRHLASFLVRNNMEPRRAGEVHWADLAKKDNMMSFARAAWGTAKRDLEGEPE